MLWEEGLVAAYKKKRVQCADLVAECRVGGCSSLYTDEVEARDSTTCLLKVLGQEGAGLHKATRKLSEEVEIQNLWL